MTDLLIAAALLVVAGVLTFLEYKLKTGDVRHMLQGYAIFACLLAAIIFLELWLRSGAVVLHPNMVMWYIHFPIALLTVLWFVILVAAGTVRAKVILWPKTDYQKYDQLYQIAYVVHWGLTYKKLPFGLFALSFITGGLYLAASYG